MPRFLLALLLLAASSLSAQSTPSPWEMENSGTTAGLRGVHAVGGGVVWASGTNGTVLRTEDSGYMWQSCAMPPGAENLDFRAVWAWDANTAVVMSSGTGDLSRIYKTTDGCSHWTLLYTNPDKDGFWDAMEFDQEPQDGHILGDPVKNEFVLLNWDCAKQTWSRDKGLEALKPLAGEAIFAASNSSFDPDEINGYYFGTGGDSGAWFIYQVEDSKEHLSWHRVRVPLGLNSATSGIFSIEFRLDATDDADRPDRIHGVTVGGDYSKPEQATHNGAWTSNGGRNWTASATPPGGFRSAVAWDPDLKLWITVGPNGSDLSRDDGKTWQPIEHAPPDIGKGGEWNALSLPWVVGPNGRIAKLNYERLQPAGKRLKPPSGARPRHPLG